RLFPDGTGSDEWYFDYQSGVLHFIGDTLPSAVVSGKSIFITGARYVGATGLAGLDTSGNTTPAVQGTLPASQTFLYNGVTLSYTLTETPSSPDAIDVYVNDVLQRPGEAFVVNGNILTLTGAPPGGIGDEIYVKYRYPYATVIDLPNNSIENRHLNLTYTSDQYSGTGSQVVYDINPGHNVHNVLVIVNGLVLPPDQYQINGTVLTLNSPPLLSATVDIRYLPV
ncbi:MAG TPA: hypothetical protein VLA40_01235, partial [Rheinheimera sp.]|nr:hypothetical protein [Rheinheimera sp.]